MDMNGTGQVPLTSNKRSVDQYPGWSPIGGQILFASNRPPANSLEIFTMDANGGGRRDC